MKFDVSTFSFELVMQEKYLNFEGISYIEYEIII